MQTPADAVDAALVGSQFLTGMFVVVSTVMFVVVAAKWLIRASQSL
jgi:hypothetical protein